MEYYPFRESRDYNDIARAEQDKKKKKVKSAVPAAGGPSPEGKVHQSAMHARGSDYHCDHTGKHDYLVCKRRKQSGASPHRTTIEKTTYFDKLA
jgi:hypothetical protein